MRRIDELHGRNARNGRPVRFRNLFFFVLFSFHIIGRQKGDYMKTLFKIIGGIIAFAIGFCGGRMAINKIKEKKQNRYFTV